MTVSTCPLCAGSRNQVPWTWLQKNSDSESDRSLDSRHTTVGPSGGIATSACMFNNLALVVAVGGGTSSTLSFRPSFSRVLCVVEAVRRGKIPNKALRVQDCPDTHGTGLGHWRYRSGTGHAKGNPGRIEKRIVISFGCPHDKPKRRG